MYQEILFLLLSENKLVRNINDFQPFLNKVVSSIFNWFKKKLMLKYPLWV